MIDPPFSFVAAILVGLMLGGIAGSFTSTILLRWPQGRSVASGRSACDGCGKPLGVAELVPIVSFLAARGRCQKCGDRIDPAHFAMELACAAIGAVSLGLDPGPAGLVTALFGWWLLLIAALDLDHHWLPDRLTLPLLPLGLLIGWAGIGPPLQERLFGAIIGYAVLALIRAGYRTLRGREGMGGGDAKLLAALGAWLGWQQLPHILLGAGLLGLASVLVLQMRGTQVRADHRLPLGTLMAIAAWPLWLIAVGS